VGETNRSGHPIDELCFHLERERLSSWSITVEVVLSIFNARSSLAEIFLPVGSWRQSSAHTKRPRLVVGAQRPAAQWIEMKRTTGARASSVRRWTQDLSHVHGRRARSFRRNAWHTLREGGPADASPSDETNGLTEDICKKSLTTGETFVRPTTTDKWRDFCRCVRSPARLQPSSPGGALSGGGRVFRDRIVAKAHDHLSTFHRVTSSGIPDSNWRPSAWEADTLPLS
jgi:hypothetical protein